MKLNYDRYIGLEFDFANYSRSQFSKSIQRLEEIGLIERYGGPRTSTYQVHTIDRHSRRELERVSRRSFARNPQILALFSAIEASTAQTDSLIRY